MSAILAHAVLIFQQRSSPPAHTRRMSSTQAHKPTMACSRSGSGSLAHAAAHPPAGKTVCLGGRHRRWLVKVKAMTATHSKDKQKETDSKASEEEEHGAGIVSHWSRGRLSGCKVSKGTGFAFRSPG